MPTSACPFMDTVTTTLANTPYSLATLLAALPATRQPLASSGASGVVRAASIQIQADPAGGAAKYYIGSSASMTTTTSAGLVLQASQAWAPPNVGGNLYILNQIYLYCDTASGLWYVNFVTR